MRCPNLIFLALTVYHTLFCHDKHNLSLLLRSHPILSFSRRRVYVSKSIRDKPRRVCTTLQLENKTSTCCCTIDNHYLVLSC
ncbi:hypothetical protein PF005_g28828 [Phytophthora fragariae]|uniref:Uncharacterized protein n=1 Tax=Phytophthora fragariae TaxID=53985 RepID=A0A6A4BBK7_9STRA|nr:hypothetical protein PF003_g29605 [Phytophthora fragariae]KAE8920016.1 hypothetical protein PF009_g29684 [Phytophthora fragariae]KAE9064697.1 hypothetical protein PF007_g29102 [Phytophthora fragariae]KAE9072402.1 hypothetical protein PF006_g28938 [Phytophthora fragariae]KAE9167333.1 hypothetical protein PF005_g28828 [Phytophthora fragariae]